VLDQEEVGWANTEHDGWITVQAISEALPAGGLAVLPHRQSGNVADAAPLQVARTGVVNVMALSPMTVRRQREGADDPSHPIVEPPLSKQRAMTAVMLDHEKADKKTGSRNGYDETEPEAPLQDEPRSEPAQHKEQGCDRDFNRAAGVAGFPVVTQNSQPIMRCGRRWQSGVAQAYIKLSIDELLQSSISGQQTCCTDVS
jgi:hypothetical protein